MKDKFQNFLYGLTLVMISLFLIIGSLILSNAENRFLY